MCFSFITCFFTSDLFHPALFLHPDHGPVLAPVPDPVPDPDHGPDLRPDLRPDHGPGLGRRP